MELQLSVNMTKSIGSLANITGQTRLKDTPALTGVKITVTDNKLTAIATDRYMLAKTEFEIDNPTGESKSFVMPLEAIKYLKANKQLIKMTVTDDYVTFDAWGNTTSFALLKSAYPNVETMFDEHNPTAVNSVAGNDTPLLLNLELLGIVSKLVDYQDNSRSQANSWTVGISDNLKPLVLSRANITVLFQPSRITK
nr:MAG TPA: beta clamp protein [Caudoviricetes sp.]